MGDYPRLVGLGQALFAAKHTVYSEHVHFLLLAIGSYALGDREQAALWLELSAKNALPDKMIHPFVEFSWLLQEFPSQRIESSYPQFLAQYMAHKKQYSTGRHTLHNAIVADRLSAELTKREREVAVLAAEGLHNNEIAKKLFVSEHTVRAHLRSIYQKLDIDRRAKLAGRLG